jgi:RHS repeat-associated protein
MGISSPLQDLPPTTYSYDLNGNLETRVQGGITKTHIFDSQDRLTNITSPSLNIQYQYDGLFNRVAKTDSGTTTKYFVDPNGVLPQVIAEMDNGGNITSYYVYDGIGLVAKITPGGAKHFYHFDGSGNAIAMTDSSGNMVNKYAYDEFGNLLNSIEAISNPFLYVGQYGVMDDDSGLFYMRARYYDPAVGRFISKDPIGFTGGLNLYGYANNNPINKLDPLGLTTAWNVTDILDSIFIGWQHGWDSGNYECYSRCLAGPLYSNVFGHFTLDLLKERIADFLARQYYIFTDGRFFDGSHSKILVPQLAEKLAKCLGRLLAAYLAYEAWHCISKCKGCL